MKYRIAILFCILYSAGLLAQSGEKKIPFVQPRGYTYVPNSSKKPGEYGFFVMIEPVRDKEFKEYMNSLYSGGKLIDGNICMSAMASDKDPRNPYAILSDSRPIESYAQYLSKKYSNADYEVKCRLVSEKEWKQMKGPAYGQYINSLNPYGIIFLNNFNEFKLNEKGIPVSHVDINGYTRSGFRFVLTYTTKK